MLFIYFFILILIFLLLYMVKEAFSDRVLEQSLSFSEFPESFNQIRIFFISDIHRREISDQIISKVTSKADLVIIGGDLAERWVPYQRVARNIRKLKSIAPVYFVWGNNDYELDYSILSTLLVNEGVIILQNTAVSFHLGENHLFHIIGVDDVGLGRDQLDKALDSSSKGGFRLLISHNPKIIHKLLPEHHIQLVLSGHTHGGQIRIFGFGPYEKGGIKKVGKSFLLVSNGYGTTALPLRLGAKAETHLITIKHLMD